MAEENGKRWYVLRSVSGKEQKVRENIEAEMHNSAILEKYVTQILIPTENVVSVRNGKQVVKERNYLPGYVFVECYLNSEVQGKLRDINFVIGFLCERNSTDPSPLRESEMKRLIGLVDEVSISDPEMEVPYMVGESVKVNAGPFSGFIGVVEEVNKDKKKLKVMVKIFGRKTPLELGYAQVVKE